MANQIYSYFIQKIIEKLPTCDDTNTIILSYISPPKQGVCKLLSYKLIHLGNVQNSHSLVKKAIKMDQCRAVFGIYFQPFQLRMKIKKLLNIGTI